MGRLSPFHVWTYVISFLFETQDQEGDFCMTMKWRDLREREGHDLIKGIKVSMSSFVGF